MVVKIELDMYVYNPRATTIEIRKVTGVNETEYRNKKYLWLKTERAYYDKIEAGKYVIYAKPGDVYEVRYSTGSRSKTYFYWHALVIPREGEEDQRSYGIYKVSIKNGEILAVADELMENTEIKARMIDDGYAISKSRPEDNVLAYFYKKWSEEVKQLQSSGIVITSENPDEEIELQEDTTVQSKEDEQMNIELEEEEELELEGVETTTATGAAPAKQPAEEKKQQLVKVYFLRMRLPSKYLVQQIKYEKNGAGYHEIRAFDDRTRAAVASRLEGIRREAYEKIRRVFCQVEEFGVWVAVSDEAIEEAKKISEWIQQELKKIAALYNLRPDIMNKIAERYSIRAIPVYMEPEDAKELLNAAISKLSADAEELRQKIEQAQKEKKRSALKRLEQQYEYTKALLEAFKRYLASIA